MATVRFETLSGKDFPEFQGALNRALDESFAAQVMQRTWSGQALYIEAPGTRGVVRFDAGRVTAEIDLEFPATLMREQIIQDIQRMIRASGGSPVNIL